MLKILNESTLRAQDDIEKEYPESKYIWIVDDINDLEGRLYAVSDDLSSSHELYLDADRLRKQGKLCIVSGNYNSEDIAGVQFIS